MLCFKFRQNPPLEQFPLQFCLITWKSNASAPEGGYSWPVSPVLHALGARPIPLWLRSGESGKSQVLNGRLILSDPPHKCFFQLCGRHEHGATAFPITPGGTETSSWRYLQSDPCCTWHSAQTDVGETRGSALGAVALSSILVAIPRLTSLLDF